MRSPTNVDAPSSVDIVVKAVLEAFPGLDPARLRDAVERATAKIARATLDTEGVQVVDLHLARVEATEAASERAQILRDLGDTLEQRGDTDRALVVRLAAFSEAPVAEDLDPLGRLAAATGRYSELPLEQMAAMIDPTDDAAARRLTEIALAWKEVGRAYHAADCLERVLAIAPEDAAAHGSLVELYRASGEHGALVDLLARRAVHAADDDERARVLRDMAEVYDKDLGDDVAALDAYREVDKLDPGRPEVLDAIARISLKRGGLDDEALDALEREMVVVIEPAERARVALKAAEVARLVDYDRAQALFERATREDPTLVAAVDGLAGLLRDRGELAKAADLLAAASERIASERGRWLTDAADFTVAVGDVERAKTLYLQARRADPTNDKAGYALVELCKDTGALVELAPILDELVRTTEEPGRLRGYLIARSKVAAEVGDSTGARNALARAVDLDPHDLATRKELVELLYAARKWDRAKEALDRLSEDEDRLPAAERATLHARAARCAKELGDREAAARHVGIALALEPKRRDALAVREELEADDPRAAAALEVEKALQSEGTADDKATRFGKLGDRYAELGEPAMAREMYREALVHRPGDHRILTKFLALVAEDGDWSYTLDLVRRLIDTEKDAVVRARYRHVAAMIARDELEQPEAAIELLGAAVEDEPGSFAIADELEATLADPEQRIGFYYRRLEHVKQVEGRAGERLRLWDRLGQVCEALGRIDDAVAAYEVALTLDPTDARRRTLADLAARAGDAHVATAIGLQLDVLRGDKRRGESYRALRALYQRAGRLDAARACEDAMTVVGADTQDRIEELFGEAPVPLGRRTPTIARPLSDDDWAALARPDVDVLLSSLFQLVARPFAAERARARPPQGVPTRLPDLPGAIAEAVQRIVEAFAIASPPIYLDRDQAAPSTLSLRTRPGAANALVPVIAVGRSASQLDARELAFVLARQLADLRKDRMARLLCPRAGELAQLIELATTAASHGTRWLAASLHPLEVDQALALGARLAERGVQPLRAALDWLAATERAGDRIGLVVTGDLASCVRVLDREGSRDRIDDLVVASVTPEVLGARAHVEGWT